MFVREKDVQSKKEMLAKGKALNDLNHSRSTQSKITTQNLKLLQKLSYDVDSFFLGHHIQVMPATIPKHQYLVTEGKNPRMGV